MQLRSLYLKNFRIYNEAYFEFGPRINMICGANAVGKTTILEALYLLMAGRSFRTTQTADLVKNGASGFHVEASFIKYGITQTLKFSYEGKERKIVYNSTCLQSSGHLIGLLQGVLHVPDDVQLVKGSPLLRRHFLDLQIAQTDPLYIHHLTRYNRAMRQRNVLLRAKNPSTLETWEKEMAIASAYITRQRSHTVGHLSKLASGLHHDLVGTHEYFSLQYKTDVKDFGSLCDYYVELFKRHRAREMDFGITLYGPHKDDVLLELNQCEARHFGSEGQQRSCVSTLRMAEWMRLKAMSEEAPLFFIDDLGISLDSDRRRKLLGYLPDLNQVFLTLTQPIDIGSSTHLIEIKSNF